jgi:autotransporter passenger strand-loop-strand repeat protein
VADCSGGSASAGEGGAWGAWAVSSGGTASNTIVSGGGLFVLSGGLADPTIIHNGGSETISSGGVDHGAQISGGAQLVSGFASGVTIFAGSQVHHGCARPAVPGCIPATQHRCVASGGTAIGAKLKGGYDVVFGSAVNAITSRLMRVSAFGLAAGWKLCVKMRISPFRHIVFRARNWNPRKSNEMTGKSPRRFTSLQ